MTILSIDFEASCLPRHGRSFPIEVGLAGDGMTRSWLIRPHDAWAGWDWTAEAQALHGLTYAQVVQDGMPADVVLAQLVEAVAGRRVVADSLIDQYWLDTLAAAAGKPSPFVVDHIALVLNEHPVEEARIAAAVAIADRHCPTRHRAGSDARWLAMVIAHLSPTLAGSRLPVLAS